MKRILIIKPSALSDAQGLLRSGFLTRITAAKTRTGFAHAREGAALAYTHKIPLPQHGTTTLAVDRMRALGQPLGTDITKPAEFRMPIHPNAVQLAQETLQGSYVAVIPGARWNTKRWPIERYTELVRKLIA